MGRTALYRDPIPFYSARAEVQLDADELVLRMPDGRLCHHQLHGYAVVTLDGFVMARVDTNHERHFVRMLVLERGHERLAVITPPEHGTVAPNVVRVPEAPADAAIVEPSVWNALADWMLSGGRLAACTIEDLARLVVIATTQFAVLIGEVAAQRALELAWAARGPLRSGGDLETSLRPLVDAAEQSPRAAEALISAHAHAAGATRRRRKLW
ncbi:MAG: hypothetical protein ABI867_08525 [Kofleriaceae bacterium]